MELYLKIILFTYIIMTVIVGKSCEKLPYGSPCKTDAQCRGRSTLSDRFSYSNVDTDDRNSICWNSRCNCSFSQTQEFENNNYVCKRHKVDDERVCKLDEPETCLNGVCDRKRCICNDGFIYVEDKCREIVNVKYSEECITPADGPVPVCNYDLVMQCSSAGKCGCFRDYFYDKQNKICIRKEEYVEKYPEEAIAGLNELCGISAHDLPKVCDETANMSCENRKCRCTEKFYPFEKNNSCKSKESYAKEHNLPRYEVKRGLYCSNDWDCITGLECWGNKCHCRRDCRYNSNTLTCECETEKEDLSTLHEYVPVFVVVSLGALVIVIICIRDGMLRRTMQHKNTRYVIHKPLDERYEIKSRTTGTGYDVKKATTRYDVKKATTPVSSYADYAASVPSYPTASGDFTASHLGDEKQSPLPKFMDDTFNLTPYNTSFTDPSKGDSTGSAINVIPDYPISSYSEAQNSDSPTIDIYKPIIF